MENPTNKLTQTLLAAIIVLVIALLGVGGYFFFATGQEGEDTNATAVINTAVNENVNQMVNTNTVSNANEAENVNFEVDTSNWLTYTNTEYSYTMQYPSDWTVEEVFNDGEPKDYENWESPLRSVEFFSPNQQYVLIVGIKSVEDPGSFRLGGGIGAGNFTEVGTIEIAGINIPMVHNIYEGKVKDLFIPAPGLETTLEGFKFGAQTVYYGDDDETNDLVNDIKYYQILEILKTLEL